MKKTMRLLILSLCLLAAPMGVNAQSLVFHLTSGKKGDVNGDGKVDVADIATIISIMAGDEPGYFYFGTTKPTTENYNSLPGVVSDYTSIAEASGATASVAAGETLYMLCPASWTDGKSVTMEDEKGNSYYFLDDFDTVTISDHAIYKTQVWDAAATVTIKTSDMREKLMKVVINELEGVNQSRAFYVRTKYNSDKDIITVQRFNANDVISFEATYVGPKNLNDEELLTSEYLVSTHTDSTGPLLNTKQYDHLYEQHGYPVPRIANSTGLTSQDVGSSWKDQLNREFTIGKISDSNIWLVPKIYKDAAGHDVRDWKNASSPAITSLTHVSGALHTSDISVSGISVKQLRPIMSHTDRRWLVDGKPIAKAGVYYCDDFSVSERQTGYDPATIQDWFGGVDGSPVLTGAQALVEMDYSFNYKGAQCAVNTTLNILREIEFTRYGATQQQFFLDNGDYVAKFLVPKAATQQGVVLDQPFSLHSLDSQSPRLAFLRSNTYLKDEDDLIDRMIGYLHNPSTNDYLVGMAAGLSLVSGDTTPDKRKQNCSKGPIDKNNSEAYKIGSILYKEQCKFYVTAVNASPFKEAGYYFPAGYSKQINYYVAYFDPAENLGQVYWYKDGNSYIIYAHCQSAHNSLAINVPAFMEGCSLSVVEKTENAVLLTDTIQNGRFMVRYNTDDANYIVLKAATVY